MKSFYPNCTPEAAGHQGSVPGQTIIDCEKVPLRQVFLRILRFSPANFHSINVPYSFIHHPVDVQGTRERPHFQRDVVSHRHENIQNGDCSCQ